MKILKFLRSSLLFSFLSFLAGSIIYFHSYIFLRTGTAKATCGTAYSTYESLGGDQTAFVRGRKIYLFESGVISKCGGHEFHALGWLALENPDAERIPMDGRNDKTGNFDANPTITDGHLSFTDWGGCRVTE